VAFGRDDAGEFSHLIPSQALEQAVKDNGLLKYEVQKLFTDVVNDKVASTQPNRVEDKLDMDELMADVDTSRQPLNIITGNEVEMNARYFKMQARDSVRRYTFRKKHIHLFFNLLVNFIAQRLPRSSATQATQYSTMIDGFHVEVVSPQPFIGCVFANSLITYFS